MAYTAYTHIFTYQDGVCFLFRSIAEWPNVKLLTSVRKEIRAASICEVTVRRHIFN